MTKRYFIWGDPELGTTFGQDSWLYALASSQKEARDKIWKAYDSTRYFSRYPLPLNNGTLREGHSSMTKYQWALRSRIEELRHLEFVNELLTTTNPTVVVSLINGNLDEIGFNVHLDE